MKQKHYRVYLYPKYNGVCIELAMMALESNGVPGGKFTLEQLEMCFKVHKLKEKWEVRNCICEVNGHLLTIDETEKDIMSGKTETRCLMAIEEVELLIPEPEEPPYLMETNTERGDMPRHDYDDEDHGTITLNL